jgi:UDP-N-acetylglucosamine diphosphorylase / glucose-1-phosphate thymidylyltransferase / UDP-N-acetylgalactosamine diphosphorylase / glucosamine-1-phosphate N-acetyltransferase / galactosamine-1-phosphate N-acetyltransferase
MRAVILAAGRGTRLYPYTKIVPKPLVPISTDNEGKFVTIIERIIKQLVNAGIKDIIIIVNYKEDMIKEYLGDGQNYSCQIRYRTQDVLDGNAGAFYCAQDLIDDNVIITDCDNYFEDNEFFIKIKKYFTESDADLTVGVSTVDTPSKYAIIKTDEDRPIDIFEKPKDNSLGTLAKSGVLILKKKVAQLDKKISKIGEEYTTTQIVKYCIENDYNVNLFKMNFNDIGTWEEYNKVFFRN